MSVVVCGLVDSYYSIICLMFFFFNDTATTEIYTLSLHDALPIFVSGEDLAVHLLQKFVHARPVDEVWHAVARNPRSEEHTSELQSRQYLVCRLLLEKKKNINIYPYHTQHIITLTITTGLDHTPAH